MLLTDPGAVVDYLCPAGIWRTRADDPPAKWTFKESRPLTHVWGYTVTAPRGLTRFYRLVVEGDLLTVDARRSSRSPCRTPARGPRTWCSTARRRR